MNSKRLAFFSSILLLITSLSTAQNNPKETSMMKDSSDNKMMMDKNEMMDKDDMMKIFINDDGIAIKGYDPVAYFVEEKPVMGKKEYSYSWKNAAWYFSNEENKMMFESNPEKYTPQYGGHCAYAASKGYYAPVDPTAWMIHNGKLYLNYNSEVSMKFEQNLNENIMNADMNWKEHKLKEKM